MSEDVRKELAVVQADIARVAAEQPTAVIIAALEVLIEVAAGDNPFLREYKKLQLYRGIRSVLGKNGIR